MSLSWLGYSGVNTIGSPNSPRTITFSSPPLGTRIFALAYATSPGCYLYEAGPTHDANGWTRFAHLADGNGSELHVYHKVVTSPITTLSSIQSSGARLAVAAWYGNYDLDLLTYSVVDGAYSTSTVALPSLGDDGSGLSLILGFAAKMGTGASAASFTAAANFDTDFGVFGNYVAVRQDAQPLNGGTRSFTRTASSTNKNSVAQIRLVPMVETDGVEEVTKGTLYVPVYEAEIFPSDVYKGVLYTATRDAYGELQANKGVVYAVVREAGKESAQKAVVYTAVDVPLVDPQSVQKGTLYIGVREQRPGDLYVAQPTQGPTPARWRKNGTYPLVRINDSRFAVYVEDPGTYSLFLLASDGTLYAQEVVVSGDTPVTVPIVFNFNQMALVKAPLTSALQSSVRRTMLLRRVPSSSL